MTYEIKEVVAGSLDDPELQAQIPRLGYSAVKDAHVYSDWVRIG
jgi:hypothetical protein